MAATLAYGPGAVVSHRSAASLWQLLPMQPGAPVDISVPGDGGKKTRPRTRVHRRISLQPGDTTRHRLVPTTTPARTIADLRTVATQLDLRRAIRQAEVLGLRIGTEAFERSTAFDGTRSELEHRFLRLCRQHRLPPPVVNARIGSLVVDFFWPERNLIVETDGYRYHRGRQAFEDDRARDLLLRGQGYEVVRLTFDQVMRRPGEIIEVLRKILENSHFRP